MSTSKRDSFHKNSSDWTCSDSQCGNLNFARRNECNRCHKAREDPSKNKGSAKIGQAAAKNSRGLFSADDWSCTKCGNINWARRNVCNICNAKKNVDEEERRTGLGGGFNEREKVEYKQRRPSSDDEYDEFGRRKKFYERSRKKSETSRKSRRDRSSSSSSRSRSRSHHRRSSSSSTSSSSSSSSDASRHRRRSRTPKKSTAVTRKSKSRSRSQDRFHDSRKDNRTNERNEKQEIRREKSSSRSESEEESDSEEDGGDLSKYNLFDDDDIDIEALRRK